MTDQLSQCKLGLQKLELFSEKFQALSQRLDSMWIEWSDIQATLSTLDDDLSVDPARLEVVNQTRVRFIRSNKNTEFLMLRD